MTSWVWGFYYHFFPAKHGGHDSVPSATSRGGHLERGGPRRSGGGGRQLLPFRGPVAGVLGGVFPRDLGGKSCCTFIVTDTLKMRFFLSHSW